MDAHGKELVFKVLNHEPVEQVPWVPFAGVHAGKLKGYTATELLTNQNKLVECLIEANHLYHADGQPIAFDLQVEAEILGCELRWADKAPPSVNSHPLVATQDIPEKIPQPDEGRLPIILGACSALKAEAGDHSALFGLVTGPLTLASHLRGTGLFMDIIRDKKYVRSLLSYAKDIAIAMAGYYASAGADIIAVVDPVVSQVSPKAFTELLTSPFQDIFHAIKDDLGLFTSFFVCGDATKNIEPMCLTKPDSIFVDENIDMIAAKQITDQHYIVLGGNIPLTRIMLYGNQLDNMNYVIGLLDDLGTSNLVIAPGCDMPYDVPPENVIGIEQAIHEPVSVRKMLENYRSATMEEAFELPDYNNLEKPLIEVFTIDSAMCAACGYMVNLANSARAKFGDAIDIVEYKSIDMDNIKRAQAMGIKHMPCILINGKMKYSSIIPDQANYFKEIEKELRGS
jgi:uroporphyrinogen decarboxylase